MASMDRRKALLIAAAVVAALGTTLVYLYVRGADSRADSRFHAVQVLRAVKEIAPGETVAAAKAAGKIQLGTVGQADLLQGALTDTSTIDAMVATAVIHPGEQIIASKFGTTASGAVLTIPDGQMAISVNLTDPARVAGFVNPGDEVAVFVNGAPQADATRLLLPKVKVIAVGTTTPVSTTTTTSTGASTTEQLPRTLLTLAVSQDEAERILFASRASELAFALLTKTSQVAPSAGVTASNLFR